MIKRFLAFANRNITKFTRSGKKSPRKTLAKDEGNKRSTTQSHTEKQQAEQSPDRAPDQTQQVTKVQADTRPDGKSSIKKRRKKKRWTQEQFEVVPVPGKSRFHDFGLPAAIMHAIADLDFQYCTPIQEKSLPHVMEGKDLIGKAHTGTGKSAVFLITILTRLLQQGQKSTKEKSPRALVIAPTRELVIQIAKDGRQLAQYTPLKITAVFGGADYQKQIDTLQRGKTDIIVATPGRLLDFVGKKIVSLRNCEIMVIDEADRMLDMGFIPDVRRIISRLPEKSHRQTLLFSATITEEVKRLASQWCKTPQLVEIEPEQVAVETVDQIVYLVTTEEKYTVLYNLIAAHKDERIIVFANQKAEVRKLYERLQRNNIHCTMLSGDVPQNKRLNRLENFRSGRVNVLIATDVAGRGIHIEGISHVVNYTLPYEPEDYVHRIGRTGRAGAGGTSISFACEEGSFYLPDIEEFIGRQLECVAPEKTLLTKPPKGSPPRHSPKRRKPGRQRRSNKNGGQRRQE